MALKLTSRSDITPVSVPDAKLAARIDHSAEDAFVNRLIKTATRACENYIDAVLMAETWSDSITGENETISVLLPVQYLSYTARYYDDAGLEIDQADSNTTIEVNGLTMTISFNQEVTVALEVLNGMTEDDPSVLDQDLKMGIELLVEAYYQDRSAATSLPKNVRQLWFPHKKVSV